MAVQYPGHWPRVVNKDAKYSVVSGEDGMQVRLVYRLSESERALLTTRDHPDLVEMVNAVKEEESDRPGGVFYINEHGHLLVPVGRTYFYAGDYDGELEFSFEGGSIGPRPPTTLAVGDEWPGPHAGIPYVLTADSSDLYYEFESQPNVQKRVSLSGEVGKDAARNLARRLAETKGSGGGRIYINEAREFFAPVQQEELRYVYLGPLGDDPWFQAPSIEGTEAEPPAF